MGFFYNRYVRLTLLLLIGILFVSIRGCDYIEKSYGFPTVHTVYANYWLYDGTPMLERGSSHLLEYSSTNLIINFIFMVGVWLVIEKIRKYLRPNYLVVFDKAYSFVLWYVVVMCVVMSHFEDFYSAYFLLPLAYIGTMIFLIFNYVGFIKLVDGEFVLPSLLDPYYFDSFDLIVRVGLSLFMMLSFFFLYIILFIILIEHKKKKK